MNEDTIKGNWKIMKGRIKQAYGDLSDDDLAKTEGNHEEIVGLIQKTYGKGRDEAKESLRKLADVV